MIPDSVRKKFQSLSRESLFDTVFAGKCLQAAVELDAQVGSGDVVLWPEETGGLAWKAAGKPYRSSGGKPFRVFCVLPDYVSFTQALWLKLSAAAQTRGNRIIPVHLHSCAVPSSSSLNRYPGFLQRILDRLYPPQDPEIVSPAVDEVSAFFELKLGAEEASVSSSGSDPASMEPESVVFRSWLEETEENFFISRYTSLDERISASAAASAAGLLPLVVLNPGEAAAASALFSMFLRSENKKQRFRFLISVEDHWDSVLILKSVLNIAVLTALSDSDLQGALSRASQTAGSVLIVDPGKSSLPSRKLHMSSWDSEEFLIVKEGKEGESGSVLLIVPGVMAREAGKAADRLKKENCSVSVLALRFPWPTDTRKIKDLAGSFDLVVVMDPSENPGGMKAELGLELSSLRELHVAVTERNMNGKELAQYAAALLREDRFHRTVDDVKKDRWR